MLLPLDFLSVAVHFILTVSLYSLSLIIQGFGERPQWVFCFFFLKLNPFEVIHPSDCPNHEEAFSHTFFTLCGFKGPVFLFPDTVFKIQVLNSLCTEQLACIL